MVLCANEINEVIRMQLWAVGTRLQRQQKRQYFINIIFSLGSYFFFFFCFPRALLPSVYLSLAWSAFPDLKNILWMSWQFPWESLFGQAVFSFSHFLPLSFLKLKIMYDFIVCFIDSWANIDIEKKLEIFLGNVYVTCI